MKIGGYENHHLSPDELKHVIADVVEEMARRLILSNLKDIVNQVYPETKDIEKLQTKPYLTLPNRRKPAKFPGKVYHRQTGSNLTKGLACWHGDLAILVNSKETGKKAIIFEVKYGRIYLSPGQHEFFKSVTVEPGKWLRKLNEVKVYIVNCYNLDIKNGTIKMKILPYRNGVKQ